MRARIAVLITSLAIGGLLACALPVSGGIACQQKINCNASPIWHYYGKTPIENDIYRCINTTVNFSVSTDQNDNDTCVDDSEICLDGPISYTWSGVTDTHTSSATGSWSQCGDHTVTCTMTDPGNYVKDKTETATWTVHVCRLTVSTFLPDPDPHLYYGCGDTSLMLICSLCQGCPTGTEPGWNVTGPLSLGEHGFSETFGYYAFIHAAAPAACEQTGTATATLNGCTSQPFTITVKKHGTYTMSPPSFPQQVVYHGEVTFDQIGEPPPKGCSSSSPVFGIINPVEYTVSISECPVPGPMDFYEELTPGSGCSCPPTDAWHNPLNGGEYGDYSVTDSIGLLTCDCNDIEWAIGEDCKTVQVVKLGECVIGTKCQYVHRYSLSGTCDAAVQEVSVTDISYPSECICEQK